MGDDGNISCMNKDVGDRRFAEGYKCDWKQKLKDRERELANDMSKQMFQDGLTEQIENERDMGSDTELGMRTDL